jgi:hypothetical protein
MIMTSTMTVTEALAAYDAAAYGQGNFLAGQRLADAVRAKLAQDSDADELAAQAEHAARTMAPPVPGVTMNADFTVRDVIYANPAGGGLLESWWVTGEAGDGRWVTWLAYAQDGRCAGRLAYTWGHYDGLDSHAAAQRDLAERAGIR